VHRTLLGLIRTPPFLFFLRWGRHAGIRLGPTHVLSLFSEAIAAGLVSPDPFNEGLRTLCHLLPLLVLAFFPQRDILSFKLFLFVDGNLSKKDRRFSGLATYARLYSPSQTQGAVLRIGSVQRSPFLNSYACPPSTPTLPTA